MRRRVDTSSDISKLRIRTQVLPSHFATLVLVTLGLVLTLGVTTATASKEIVDFFGSESGLGSLGGEFNRPYGIAVNNSGIGPAEEGEIYVVDGENNRIERFARNDNGTPAEPGDDTYDFISAWGAGVDATIGGSDYQVCTVASQCQAGVVSDGNGAFNSFYPGDFRGTRTASGIAVDQDTGEVYVADAANFRISVYTGDGTFLRSLGYDVVASGPGKLPAPIERQQLTVKANGGRFSLTFNGRATGPRGTGGRQSGSTLVNGLVPTEGTFAVGQGISGQGIPPGTTIVTVEAGTLKLSQPATESTTASTPLFGDNFPHNASAAEVQSALNALPSIGGVGGSVTVTGGPGDEGGSTPYAIEFGGSLAEEDLRSLVPTKGGLTIASGAPSATVTSLVEGGAYEVCEAASGDVCKEGGTGAGIGEVGEGPPVARGIAVSPPDGNPATGSVFLADTGNHRVSTYGLDGFLPGSFGAATFKENHPESIAVDSRGIVYASNQINNNQIERFDTQNANGSGVGFLTPIAAPPLIPSNVTDVSRALAVDPDTDGAGPDTDVLYVLRAPDGPGVVQQFGPLNPPGLTAPPAAADDEHGGAFKSGTGLSRIPRPWGLASTKPMGVSMSPPPPLMKATASTSSTTPARRRRRRSTRSATSPRPPLPLTRRSTPTARRRCATTSSTPQTARAGNRPPEVVLGSQKTPQSVSALLDPPGGGLEPGTFYHVRLIAKRPLIPAVVTSELTFTTLVAPPTVETTGSPVRTTTTARLDARVNPSGTAHLPLRVRRQGPCDVNPCTATEPQAAGAGNASGSSPAGRGLEPATTYHYRVVADNGNPGSPVNGEDMT